MSNIVLNSRKIMKIMSTLYFETPLTAKSWPPIKNFFSPHAQKSPTHNDVAPKLNLWGQKIGGGAFKAPPPPPPPPDRIGLNRVFIVQNKRIEIRVGKMPAFMSKVHAGGIYRYLPAFTGIYRRLLEFTGACWHCWILLLFLVLAQN